MQLPIMLNLMMLVNLHIILELCADISDFTIVLCSVYPEPSTSRGKILIGATRCFRNLFEIFHEFRYHLLL